MDKQSLVTFIVDLLRNGQENRALDAGGPMAAPGVPMPTGVDSRHGGQLPMDIVDQAVTGRGAPAIDPMARSPRQ